MIEKAKNMCRSLIGERVSVTDVEIDSAIEQVMYMPFFSGIDTTQLKNELLSTYRVRVDLFKILVGKERREPWIKDYKANHSAEHWAFWNRYRHYLEQSKGFPPDIIDKIDKLTESTLDKLFDPTLQDITIDKKGLVVGQVQSGKTANYTGLICKAADAGFNLIIVLAGIHNNLRSQTQLRLDEDFLGFDTQFERAYTMNLTSKRGVGLLHGFPPAIANSITTSSDKGDFTKRAAETLGVNFDTPQPILLVVKKNATVLKRLSTWLASQTVTVNGKKVIINKSLLIIDDEADNASINTKKENESPTVINRLIRNIIGLFNRSGYVGYTATPFANIFIPLDEDNLFPRDFIINLPAPTNYIGPDKIFGTSIIPDDTNDDLLPIVRPINDFGTFVPDKHKMNDDKPLDLPESLELAIKCFIVTCAVRIARGQDKKHNSMLVHVSRYKSWQNDIKDLVESQFLYYKRGIEQNIKQIIEEFRQVYEVDTPDYISFKTTTSNIKNSTFKDIDTKLTIHSWEEILPLLYKAVVKIEVKSINGSSADALKYYDNEKTGISVIAIGGDKLSRGLTLEGLSVSYYLRASKMYDTLMQMGRWFGYRPGYVDLCRLFTSRELNEWFRHITMASEELRGEFNFLADSGSTPEDYVLKVRTHPGCLQITAVSKMRYTNTIRVSWSGRLIETYQLSKDKGIVHSNLIATDNLISSLGLPVKKGNDYLWKDVTPNTICSYFGRYKVAENLKAVDLNRICRFIQKLNTDGELTSWSVALMNKVGETPKFTTSNGISVGCFDRNYAIESTEETYLIKKNHILGNQTDEFIDLDDKVLEMALKTSIEGSVELNWKADENWKNNYPKPKLVREKYRSVTNPLLIIYPLNPECAYPKEFNGVKSIEPFLGFAICFPHSNGNHTEEFAINSVLIDKFRQSEEEFDNNNDNPDDNE
ncbi:Z1 domain-containing protein [uncultured Bacteroides sp.]|uniref:Z1 domain-containing protein n=1 Tax=uncultured Bacteroides sp. TaxID=162156 RepID=UPI002AAA9884|nr:Z1 domain-containing protein [uncultured Bacteroides sp.]